MDKDEQQKSPEQNIESQQLEVQEVLSHLPPEMLLAALHEKGFEAGQVTQTRQIIRQFAGPLPSPDMLQEYENTHPGLADRIVTMAESEQQHRHQLETKNVEGIIKKDTRAQIIAFLITCLITMTSALLIYTGHPVLGSLFGGATLVALVSLFLGNKQRETKKDRQEQTNEAGE